MIKINNASQFPKRFYGLHMAEGCAEYKSADGPFKIFINSNVIKGMDKSYEGKPIYVGHVDEVDMNEIEKADGYVVKSFYNKADGKHWAEFIVTTDKGMDAVNKGFRLSNAYKILRRGDGGRWHGIDYDQEILDGEYEHLALVDDPRYNETMILTPENFKLYNEQKENEIKQLANSNKTKGESMFNFFKKSKVENSADLEATMVVLPKSGQEMDLATLINAYDESLMEKKDEEVKNKKKNEEEEEEEKKENEMGEDGKTEGVHVDIDSHNEDDKEEDKKENEEEEEKKENEEEKKVDEKENCSKKNEEEEEKKEDKKENSLENDKRFDELKNAHEKILEEEAVKVDLSMDKVSRGIARYGSK